MQTEVRDPLTNEVLFGRLERGGTVRIGLEDYKLAFSCEPVVETRRTAGRRGRPAALGDPRH